MRMEICIWPLDHGIVAPCVAWHTAIQSVGIEPVIEPCLALAVPQSFSTQTRSTRDQVCQFNAQRADHLMGRKIYSVHITKKKKKMRDLRSCTSLVMLGGGSGDRHMTHGRKNGIQLSIPIGPSSVLFHGIGSKANALSAMRSCPSPFTLPPAIIFPGLSTAH